MCVSSMLSRIFQKTTVLFSPQFFLSVSFENKPNKFFTVPINLKPTKIFMTSSHEQPRMAHTKYIVFKSYLFQLLRLFYDLFSHNPAHIPLWDIAVCDAGYRRWRFKTKLLVKCRCR